jgi:hypothetical protein
MCLCVCIVAVVWSSVDDAETGQGPDLAADPVSLLGSGLITSELSIGMFVFLRNARFDAANESTANPRYWLGRITAAGPTGGPGMVLFLSFLSSCDALWSS